MKNLKQLLAEGDPLAREAELSAVDAHGMRRQLVAAAASQPAAAPFWWPRPLALAAAVAVCLVLGVSVGVRLGDREQRAVPPAPAAKEGARRQLQFSAPGGTRIIWTFHDEFEL